MPDNVKAELLGEEVADFERALPGFWWSVGYCRKGAHASCAVDGDGPQKHLLDGIQPGDELDVGFHCDTDGGDAHEALRNVKNQAITELEKRGLLPAADEGSCIACQ